MDETEVKVVETSVRVVDRIKENADELLKHYELLKKISKSKRSYTALKSKDNIRCVLWNAIKKHHAEVLEHDPPEEYLQLYRNAERFNEKFVAKLAEFGYKPDIEQISFKELSGEDTDDDDDIETHTGPSQPNLLDLNTEKLCENQEVNKIGRTLEHDKTFAMLLSKLADNQTMQIQWQMQQQTQQSINFKLPEIKVPIFGGDVNQFRYFKQTMERVMTHSKLGQIEKFVYLKSHLENDPLTMVDVLQLEESSYQKAWEILASYYNNSRQLVNHNVRMITDQKYKTNENDVNSLKKFRHTFEAVRSNLQQLQVSVDQMLAEMTVTRFDPTTASRFEDYIGFATETPRLDTISKFLMKEENHHNLLCTQNVNYNRNVKSNPQNYDKKQQNIVREARAYLTTDEISEEGARIRKCLLCSENHATVLCKVFLNATNKIDLLKSYHLCIYCGKHKYNSKQKCRGRISNSLKCETCGSMQHITELHSQIRPSTAVNLVSESQQEPQNVSNSSSTEQHTVQAMITKQFHENYQEGLATSRSTNKISILPTAVAHIRVAKQQTIPVRCLIDLCAEKSYVSEDLVHKLGIKKYKTNEIIKGINNVTTSARRYAKLQIKFEDSSLDELNINARILPEIANNIPCTEVPATKFSLNHKLADPDFNKPGKVHILLGNDVNHRIFIQNEPVQFENNLMFHSTHFGWIVCGSTESHKQLSSVISTLITINETNYNLNADYELKQQLMEFYSLPEAISDETVAENNYCETLYKSKHYRLDDGRYVVPVPWKPNGPKLGHTYRSACGSFFAQERRWRSNPQHLEKSNEFMNEYINLGHMSAIEKNEQRNETNNVCYIPYISICRNDSHTTKLRNVFNASSKSSNGVSLNDTMYEGEKLQTKIFDILLRSRSFKYIYAADITKMFRQILVLNEDRDKLRIIWRPNYHEPLNEFRLSTVTYGTDAAPWQSIRTIHQCASDNSPSIEILNIIKGSFYVDDLLHGADTISDCKRQISDIITTMSAGKFPLTKWMANNIQVIEDIPNDRRLSAYLTDENESTKLLGLIYCFKSDSYSLNIKMFDQIVYTKRGVASFAASFFDPIGFILPFIMLLRIFLRDIWAKSIDWDDKLDDKTCEDFDKYMKNYKMLHSIEIPRWIGSTNESTLELVGFSDASNDAIAAVIYSRVKSDAGYIVRFLAAKGNVTKLKTKRVLESRQQTMPKLELEAILTLINLYENIKNCFPHLSITFTAYTDSQVALAWVRNNKVGQRLIKRKVDKILNIIRPQQINYVKSEENPADAASRGLRVEKLVKCDLYYNGPSWLREPELPTTSSTNSNSTCFVVKSNENVNEPLPDLFAHITKFMLMVKVVAIMFKWITYKRTKPQANSNPTKEIIITYETNEIEHAKIILFKYYQRLHIGQIIENLQKKLKKPVPKGHWLYKLSPFLHTDGLIHIGGRLSNADMPENMKHPIAVPKSHLLNTLLRFTHLYNLHAGNSLMLRIINENFWIPAARYEISKCIDKCIVCTRWRQRKIQPEMSQLPYVRVKEAKLFENCGVDLAGPFYIKQNTLRQASNIKVWVIAFVCMVTKAIHLELTTSLDSEHFLAALDRLTSRRGSVLEIWSDNGTNFVGANRMIVQAWQKLTNECKQSLAVKEIKWHFIPRHSPSFGGIWESGIKSMKYFIYRMKDIKNLTYEHFTTLLCRVESLLNSRPITPNPLSPNEDPALTPFHFITSRNFANNSINASDNSPLTRKWLEIVKIQKHLWNRFHKEYLQTLQKKVKWNQRERQLAEDEVVLINELNTTPGEWQMGRVVKTFNDPQGTTRKVEVRRQNGKTTIEAVKNLIPLNITDTSEIAQRPTTRSRIRTITATQVCLILFSLLPGSRGLNVTALAEGVHTFHINDVYIKGLDVDFTINTNYNVTADLQILDNQLKEFQDFCETQLNLTNAVNHCSNLKKTFEINILEVKRSITSGFSLARDKRFSTFVRTAVKYALKYSPEVIMTTGLAYQSYEISQLERQMHEADSRLHRANDIIIKILKIEQGDIENNLIQLQAKQEEDSLYLAINRYAEAIVTIVSTLENRYKGLTTYKPETELMEYVQKLNFNRNTTRLIIPKTNDIFRHRTLHVKNELVFLNFEIPLLLDRLFEEFIIITVPNKNNEIIKIPQSQKVLNIVVKDETYGIIDGNSAEIYDINIWRPIDSCMQNILNTSTSIAKYCPHAIDTEYLSRTFVVNKELSVVFSRNQTITLNCSDSRPLTFKNHVFLINSSSSCIINVNNNSITGHLHGYSKINSSDEINEIAIPIIKQAKLHFHTDSINKLYKEAEEVLNSNSSAINWQYMGTSSVMAGIILFIVIALIYRCYKRHNQQERWLPTFIGPIVSEAAV